MNKISKMVAALAIGGAMIVPVQAQARPDGRGSYRGDHGRHWDGGRDYRRYDGYRGSGGYRGYADRGYYGSRSSYGGGYGRGYYDHPSRYSYAYPRYGYGGGYYGRSDDELIVGLAGLAIGAAIASDGY